jgi:hypothetical protein
LFYEMKGSGEVPILMLNHSQNAAYFDGAGPPRLLGHRFPQS